MDYKSLKIYILPLVGFMRIPRPVRLNRGTTTPRGGLAADGFPSADRSLDGKAMGTSEWYAYSSSLKDPSERLKESF